MTRARRPLAERLDEVRLGEIVALIVKPTDDDDRRLDVDAVAITVGDPLVFERPVPAGTAPVESSNSRVRSIARSDSNRSNEYELYVVERDSDRFTVSLNGESFGELRSIVIDP